MHHYKSRVVDWIRLLFDFEALIRGPQSNTIQVRRFPVGMLEISTIKLSLIKFIYSEMAIKFCEIFTLLLSYIVPVRSKEKILQNFVAFSEYMNFNINLLKL